MAEPVKLPVPTGWRLLIKLHPAKDKVGSVFLPQNTKDDQRHVMMLADVVQMGPLAYRRDDMRDAEPWCRKGDTVIFAKYAGTRFMIGDSEYRLINDDEVQAVVSDPTGIRTPDRASY